MGKDFEGGDCELFEELSRYWPGWTAETH